jgi:hypothetical protein
MMAELLRPCQAFTLQAFKVALLQAIHHVIQVDETAVNALMMTYI